MEVLGKQKAIDIFRETRKIEEDGGMMVLVCSVNFFFCIETICGSCLFKTECVLGWFPEGN